MAPGGPPNRSRSNGNIKKRNEFSEKMVTPTLLRLFYNLGSKQGPSLKLLPSPSIPPAAPLSHFQAKMDQASPHQETDAAHQNLAHVSTRAGS